MRCKQSLCWFLEHRELGFAFLRAYLGAALFVRGILFVSNRDTIVSWTLEVDSEWFFSTMAAHYVVGVHIVGGALLALGLLTRLAAVAQIPPLVVAVFVVHLPQGLLQPDQSLELSALVLVMLCVYAVWGSGHFSVDALIKALPEPDDIEFGNAGPNEAGSNKSQTTPTVPLAT